MKAEHLPSNEPAGCLDGLFKPKREKVTMQQSIRFPVHKPWGQGLGQWKGKTGRMPIIRGPRFGEGEMRGSLRF